MLVLFLIVWFGLGLAALTAMAYDALQDRPTKRYSFAYAASLGGAPLTPQRTHPATWNAPSSAEMRSPLVEGA